MYSDRDDLAAGLPHSEIHGSKIARISPWLIATCYVLHRLSVPRHPLNALQRLIQSTRSFDRAPRHSQHFSNLYADHRFTRDRAKDMCPQPEPTERPPQPAIASDQQCQTTNRPARSRSVELSSLKEPRATTKVVEPIGIEPTTSSLQS